MHDDFGLYPREESFDPFSVMLFKALQVIAFLVFHRPAGDRAGLQGRQDRLKGRVHHHHGLARRSSR